MKIKEIIKVTAVCALSIGVMSSAFAGFNRLTFNAATNGAQPLPIVEAVSPAPVALAQETQAEQADCTDVFVSPEITVIASPWLNSHENNVVSEHAMSMEEAARIGAEYIWDIFEERINGMYVEMLFASWPGQTRQYWLGNVSTDTEDSTVWNARGRVTPIFSFTIDAVTGMRIDIRRNFDPFAELSEEEREAIMQWRVGDARRDWHIAWHYKTTEQRMAYFNLTAACLEPYLEAARAAAARQFNTTTLVPETESFSIIAATGNTPGESVFAGINFTIEDNTGRQLHMPFHDGKISSIMTQHNDIIPGFYYHAPGARG